MQVLLMPSSQIISNTFPRLMHKEIHSRFKVIKQQFDIQLEVTR